MPAPSVISIIDDDASIRVATNNLLRSRGYTVHTFASAEEFLRSSHLGETSCVIADVQMSAMSGLDLPEAMRAKGKPYRVQIYPPFGKSNMEGHGGFCMLGTDVWGPAVLDFLRSR